MVPCLTRLGPFLAPCISRTCCSGHGATRSSCKYVTVTNLDVWLAQLTPEMPWAQQKGMPLTHSLCDIDPTTSMAICTRFACPCRLQQPCMRPYAIHVLVKAFLTEHSQIWASLAWPRRTTACCAPSQQPQRIPLCLAAPVAESVSLVCF